MTMVPYEDVGGVFTFPLTGQPVRTALVDGLPWFVATDVCKILGFRMASDATRALDEDERGTHSIRTPGGEQNVTIVSQSGLFALILRSRRPEAKKFRRWVTEELLPQVVRTGSYGEAAPAQREPSRRELALMVIETEDALERERQRTAVLEPAARSWDVLASAGGDFSVRDAAHILNRDPGIDTGQRRLFGVLRELGLIDRRNTPYARHSRHVVERVRTYPHPETGEVMPADPQVRVTSDGLAFLHRKLGGTSAVAELVERPEVIA